MVNIIVGENSYISLEEAENYFNGRLFSESWYKEDQDDKARALITATKRIDTLVLKGVKADREQKLQFPRIYPPNMIPNKTAIRYTEPGTYSNWYIDKDIPENVKIAVCEEAYSLLDWGNSARAKLQAQGVKSAKMGDISEEYRIPKKLLSVEALALLMPYNLTGVMII